MSATDIYLTSLGRLGLSQVPQPQPRSGQGCEEQMPFDDCLEIARGT
ncbi:MAG: hypothetical protein JWM21_2002 [Acidobacteria bacterium]|nr:hypothetical protein [Acidobacteriota bacterium]